MQQIVPPLRRLTCDKPVCDAAAYVAANAPFDSVMPTATPHAHPVVAALSRWQSLRKGAWSLAEASAVQDELLAAIDLLSDSASGPLARSLTDLALYLGFLVDGDSAGPNAAQRQKLAQLEEAALEVLRGASGGDPRAITRKQILVLAPDLPLWRTLVERLASGSHAIERFSDAGELLSRLDPAALAALLIDQDFLMDLGTIADRLEAARGSGALGATVIYVNRSRDVRARLLALSSGADTSLEGDDLDYLVARASELVQVRQRQDHLRVLIVEDDRSQALYCEAILRKQGIETRVAMDARQVLDEIAEFAPDLVLMDLHMPDIDGTQLTALIREQPELALLPIVFVTGEQDERIRFDALRAGGDDYLVKPVRPLHLVTAVVTRARRARHLKHQFSQRPPQASAQLLHAGELVGRLRTLGVDRTCHWSLLMVAADEGRLHARDAHLVIERENQFLIGSQIRALLADDEFIAPWQSDAFVLLINHAADDALMARAEQLRQQFSALLAERGCGDVSAALVVLAPDTPLSAETLIDLAERSIAVARHAGGKRVTRALAEVQSDLPAELSLAIQKALAVEVSPAATAILYQPIVPLHGAARAQYHLHLGLRVDLNGERIITRRQWLSLARRIGRVEALDRFAVARALDCALEFRQRLPGLRIFVAVCVESLIDPGFRKALCDGMRQRELRDAGLVLSIDHSEAQARLHHLGDVREELRACRVSLCFGRTGLDARFDAAIDALRPELIAVDATATRNAAQMPPILDFARDRGAEIVAHFIPDAQSLARLFTLGVDYGLGSFIGAPAVRLDYDFGEYELA